MGSSLQYDLVLRELNYALGLDQPIKTLGLLKPTNDSKHHKRYGDHLTNGKSMSGGLFFQCFSIIPSKYPDNKIIDLLPSLKDIFPQVFIDFITYCPKIDTNPKLVTSLEISYPHQKWEV